MPHRAQRSDAYGLADGHRVDHVKGALVSALAIRRVLWGKMPTCVSASAHC